MKKFICGMVVGLCAIPVCESVTTLVSNWIEVANGIAMLRISKINKEIEDLNPPYEAVSAVGFDYSPAEEYIDEDEYLKKRGKHIGF